MSLINFLFASFLLGAFFYTVTLVINIREALFPDNVDAFVILPLVILIGSTCLTGWVVLIWT